MKFVLTIIALSVSCIAAHATTPFNENEQGQAQGQAQGQLQLQGQQQGQGQGQSQNSSNNNRNSNDNANSNRNANSSYSQGGAGGSGGNGGNSSAAANGGYSNSGSTSSAGSAAGVASVISVNGAERSAPSVNVSAPVQVRNCRIGIGAGGSGTAGSFSAALPLGNDQTCLSGAMLEAMTVSGGFTMQEKQTVACMIEGMASLPTCKNLAEGKRAQALMEGQSAATNGVANPWQAGG